MESGKVNFLIKTMVERDPQKRKVKPVQNPLLDFDLGESSDDSDFRIEDHNDSGDDSINSNDDDESDGNESDDENGSDGKDEPSALFDLKKAEANLSGAQLLAKASEQQKLVSVEYAKIMVCCACLGDRSDSINEIVECDGCGVTVHEACYGVSDTASLSSNASSCSTEPWFCEVCKAGVSDPCCELCPNKGGVFKETDVGKWVHLVCALYVPGVAFGEVDKLSNVTLFEMAYNKWGAKPCILCSDEQFVRTGVTIGCDAGMCRETFHVTCAQREGLLAEAHSDEFEHADPFYAHCKQHTDKFLMRKRRRNWLALQMRKRHRLMEIESRTEETAEQIRIKRKLISHSHKYKAHKKNRPQPWMPTQKMSRLITTSFSACIALARKSKMMCIDIDARETEDAQIASIVDARKKWHLNPAFSVEYVAYYLDRNVRLCNLRSQLQEFLKTNGEYTEQQKEVQAKYDKLDKDRQDLVTDNEQLLATIRSLRQAILSVCPSKKLPPDPSTLLAQPQVVLSPIRKDTKKQKTPKVTAGTVRRLSEAAPAPVTLFKCKTCSTSKSQHLITKCDTCKNHYHLGCLNPPLSRMPKKTKLVGWQCTDCDKLSTGSEPECLDPEAPRKLRHSHGTPTKEESFKQTPKKLDMSAASVPELPPPLPATSKLKLGKKRKMKQHKHREGAKQRKVSLPVEMNHVNEVAEVPKFQPPPQVAELPLPVNDQPAWKEELLDGKHHLDHTGKVKRRKKRGDKPRREKGEKGEKGDKPRKKHRKKKHLHDGTEEQPRIKITIKPIMPGQYTAQLMSTQFESTSDPKVGLETNHTPVRRNSLKAEPEPLTKCDKCSAQGNNSDLVRCDECRKCYHFHCLEPPLKKTPKKRGYSWHCADCDPTDLEN